MISRIISVTMTAGRCGSSLLMQILNASGCCWGNEVNTYFENLELQKFIDDRIYPELKGFMPKVVHKLPWRGKEIEQFQKLFFEKWFAGYDGPVIVKAPYVFTSDILSSIADSRGIPFHSVIARRDIGAMVLSAMKMNTIHRSYWEWVTWFSEWDTVLCNSDYNHSVMFEDWFIKPRETYLNLFTALKLPIKLTESDLLNIINPEYRHL